MSWRPHHTWTPGPRLPSGDALSTCVHCGLLRTSHADGISAHYTRPGLSGDDRIVTGDAPPCIEKKLTMRPPRW